MATAVPIISAVPVAIADDANVVGPVLALYPLLRALRPNSKTVGSQLWQNATRGAAEDAIPPTFPAKINNQKTKGLQAKDLGKALKLAIPVDELRKIVKNAEIISGLRFIVQKSGEKTVDVVEQLVQAVLAHELEEQNMVSALELAELVLGTGPLRCRVTKSLDSKHVLGSIHDFLKWLQVDKDGKHQDWNDWLREALKESIIQGSRDFGNPESTTFVLEYHMFKGKETPMGNIKVFERIVRLCVGKSKVADGMADAALSLYTQKLAAEHPELSQFLVAASASAGTKRKKDEEEDGTTAAAIAKKKKFRTLLDQYEEQHSRDRAELVKYYDQNRSDLAKFYESNQVALAKQHEQNQIAIVKQYNDRLLDARQQYEQALAEKQHLLVDCLQKIEQQQQQVVIKVGNLPLQLCGVVNSALNGFFRQSCAASFFEYLGSYIQGKKQKKRTTHDASKYPADQRATDKELVLQKTLLSVALSEMPHLTPRVYESVKNAFGKRAKCLRVFLLAQAEDNDDQKKKPLLWTNVVGGGQQYVYLESEIDILRRAWRDTHFGATQRRRESCHDMAENKLRVLVAEGAPLGEWTSDSCSLLFPDLSTGPVDE